MNPPNSLENLIFTSPENKDEIQESIRIAAELIKQTKTVLLFTHKHVDLMPFLTGLSKTQMKNFIISYHSDVKSIVGKLLELHDWTIIPDFVILNLNSYYDVADEAPKFSEICFCISALFSYMKFVCSKKCAKSLLLLNSIGDVQIQVVIDFYFYKKTAFFELKDVRNAILNT